MPPSGATQCTSSPLRSSRPGWPARTILAPRPSGVKLREVIVAKTCASERSATRISSSSSICSSWEVPHSTAVRQATRRQTPSAASAAPCPETSPITACTAPSAVCTTS